MPSLTDRTMGGLAPAFIHRRTLGAIKGFVTGGPLGALGGFVGGGGPTTLPFTPGGLPPPISLVGCSPGFRKDASGRCIREGVVGIIERAIPGGATGVEPGTSLVPFSLVPGGVPATPIQGIRLDCPRGFVLGNDDNCYFKGVLPRALRKWPPPPRPAISAGEMRTITRANTLKGKIKTLATKSGFTCKARR